MNENADTIESAVLQRSGNVICVIEKLQGFVLHCLSALIVHGRVALRTDVLTIEQNSLSGSQVTLAMTEVLHN